MTSPKVSIIIPVYNGANFMREAIDSALSQTYQNIEVIVVNDGSNDDGATEEIALEYGGQLKYFSKPNGGVSSALNLGILKMSGEYFSWLSHDDIYMPSKIREQVDFLKSYKNQNIIIYTDFEIFYEGDEAHGGLCSNWVESKYFRPWLTASSALHGCSLLIPKKAFFDCGFFSEQLRATQDYDLWFKMAKLYTFIHLNKCLIRSRQHVGQGIHSMPIRVFEECNLLHLNFINNLSAEEVRGYFGSTVTFGYFQMAKSLWSRGYSQAADRACLIALSRLSITDIWFAIIIPVAMLKQKLGNLVINNLVGIKKQIISFMRND